MRQLPITHYRDEFYLRPLTFGESFDLFALQKGDGGTRAAMGFGLSRAVCNADGSPMFADAAEAESGLTYDEATELFARVFAALSVDADAEKNSETA